MFYEWNIFDRAMKFLCVLGMIAFVVILCAMAIGVAFPHTCIWYSAECQSYKMEQCLKSEMTTADCVAIVNVDGVNYSGRK